MDEFLKFVGTLPQPLGKEEQKELLRMFTQTKDLRVRGEIIEHNLRLCAKFAMQYASINNREYEVDDIYMECVYAMENALDVFDANYKTSFSHFAWKYMSTHLLNNYLKNAKDASFGVDDIKCVTEDGEELPFIESVIDEDNIDFIDSFFYYRVVSDIKDFVQSWDDNQLKLIISRCLGLGGGSRISQAQLCKELNMPDSTMSSKYNKGLSLIKEFLISKYGNDVLGYSNNKSPRMESFEERNKKIFDAFYGLNGYDVCTGKEIVEKFNLQISDITVLNIVHSMRKKLTVSGELTEEDLVHLEKGREEKLFEKQIPLMSYVYDSVNGLNGREKKSMLALSKELQITRSVLYSYLDKYKVYLLNESVDEKSPNS